MAPGEPEGTQRFPARSLAPAFVGYMGPSGVPQVLRCSKWLQGGGQPRGDAVYEELLSDLCWQEIPDSEGQGEHLHHGPLPSVVSPGSRASPRQLHLQHSFGR